MAIANESGGLHRARVGRVVLLRPGALGDVLVLRGVIRFFKDTFPLKEVVLAAPGERGRFLCRPGWADRALDWERAMFSWLFSPGAEPPPPELVAALGDTDMFIAYVDADGESLSKRLSALAPGALAMFSTSRPPSRLHSPIGEWMVKSVANFCLGAGLITPDSLPDVRQFCDARIHMTEPPPDTLHGQPYTVLHPGSGSRRKNWPLPHFIELGRRLSFKADAPLSLVPRLVVVSGEADGDAGSRLVDALPGSLHVHGESLDSLALLLANASLYVGNDSGVSHLAASVKNREGDFPKQTVLFGPSDAAVWAPPGACIVQARDGLEHLSPDEVLLAIQAFTE